jgi:hypothetical protein
MTTTTTIELMAIIKKFNNKLKKRGANPLTVECHKDGTVTVKNGETFYAKQRSYSVATAKITSRYTQFI